MRSLLATSFNQYQNTRSLLAISNNLESHLAIPFNQHEIWGPIWRPPLMNIEIRDPFWRSPLINLESHLAIPFIQSWNTRSLLATSFDQYRNTRSFLAISNNMESHLAIPYYQSWYQCRSSWWQGSKLFIFSLFLVLLVVPESTMVQNCDSLLSSTQWFFLRP